jgi:phenylalanyl-tRNA synthetase beta chain
MKLSLNWLNSYFDTAPYLKRSKFEVFDERQGVEVEHEEQNRKDQMMTVQSINAKKPDWEDILHKLTMAGIEVESITEAGNDAAGTKDQVLELKITPNRGDCLSVLGILREISALTGALINLPPQIDLLPNLTNKDKVGVKVHVRDKCPNYIACVIKGINNQVQLPQDILSRLELSGIRSVSPVVDITNYVMLELGQPLHAFDMARVGDLLQVRFANLGEKLKLLDGQEVDLTADTLVICDADNQVAAIAGVMGGEASGVVSNTKNIVLESAFFIPEVVAGQAKYYGVNSDSAYRFERGVDPKLQELAVKYAAVLITKYCGGQVSSMNANIEPFVAKTISLRYDAITNLLGMPLEKSEINSILSRLGFSLTPEIDNNFKIEVPSHRFDINITQDIVEEVARIYGYDNIMPVMPLTYGAMNPLGRDTEYQQNLKDKLVALGYNEIVSYAFLEDKFEALYGLPGQNAIKLQNSIAGFTVMRTSLIANLLKSLVANLNRGHKWVRIFELARVFHGEDENNQPLKLSGLIYGNYQVPGWANKPLRGVDFYDIKHDVEDLLSGIGNIDFVACCDYPLLHSGRCAKILAENREIGIIGQLHPKYLAELCLSDLPYVFELDITTMLQLHTATSLMVKAVSKFQKVERDLAFLLDAKTNVGHVVDAIWQVEIPYLKAVNVFDVYQGDNLPLNFKSIAINFLFQGDKTLSEEEINANIRVITSLVKNKFKAILR